MKYVVIGNSAAAIGCIEGIRTQDGEGSVTVVASEPYHTYSRPLISYLLCGKTDEQRMKYRPDDFYEKNNCVFLPGETVGRVDPKTKTVYTDSGKAIAYDKLMVAAGSRPFVPPVEGLEGVAHRYTFMTLDDAKRLFAALDENSRVLIVGAGLIGLKCAEGISGKAGNITVVDLAPRILPSILDEEGAETVKRHIEKQGIEFLLNDSVVKFTGQTALLQSGKSVAFDVLVMAVGVRPNTELFPGKKARGICTNARGETSVADIYAAGDCAESHDITTGEDRVIALLPNAYMQGYAAGVNMAGGCAVYDKAMPMNAIGFFGLHMITAGSCEGEAYVERRPEKQSYKKLFSRDGVLKGYILIGSVERAGIYTALIREQTPLDTVDYELIREKPQLMAFSRSERAKKLGGAQ